MPKYLALFSYTDTAMAAMIETHELFTDDDVHHILETARTARDHFTRPGQ